MTNKTITPQDFDNVLDGFLLELQTATPSRAAQLEEVISIILEEKEARFPNDCAS